MKVPFHTPTLSTLHILNLFELHYYKFDRGTSQTRHWVSQSQEYLQGDVSELESNTVSILHGSYRQAEAYYAVSSV